MGVTEDRCKDDGFREREKKNREGAAVVGAARNGEGMRKGEGLLENGEEGGCYFSFFQVNFDWKIKNNSKIKINYYYYYYYYY